MAKSYICNMKRIIGSLAIGMLLAACSGNNGHAARSLAPASEGAASVPAFTADADSLYSFVERQVSFGPRVPGSDAHRECRDYIISALKAYGVDSVAVSRHPVTTFKGENYNAFNIFGSINPAARERILLLAHYDTRPWADEDPDPSLRDTPIDGANDGASGVAVLLETARLAARQLPDSIGVDLLFTDMEDSGRSGGGDTEDSWCLGTREWVKEMPYDAGNKPRFGILLDMVGGTGARFHREYFSDRMAPAIVDRIWALAREAGYADRFVNSPGGAVVDDHIPVNRAGIPCVDIIESLNPHTGSFNPTWHTTADNLSAIDRNSLKAAAQTVLNAINSL